MSGKVLLTGISGFVAKHVAIELLNSGFEVLGTVRNKNSIDQTKKTLEENDVSTDKLSFIELDLLRDDGWNEAAKGCKYIIHVASPFPLKVSNDSCKKSYFGRFAFTFSISRRFSNGKSILGKSINSNYLTIIYCDNCLIKIYYFARKINKSRSITI